MRWRHYVLECSDGSYYSGSIASFALKRLVLNSLCKRTKHNYYRLLLQLQVQLLATTSTVSSSPHLLRLQMLAIENSGQANSKNARQSFLDFKLDEDAAKLRARCSDQSAKCRKARLPLRIYKVKTEKMN